MRRSWGIFLLWLAALVFALGSNKGLAYNLFYFMTGVIAFSLIWTLGNLRGLMIGRTSKALRSQVGRYFEESLELTNRSRWPKLWVEVRDFSDLPGHRIGRVVSSLGGRSASRWQVRTLCQQRGRYTLGPISLTSGDPLGIFRFTRRVLPLAGSTSSLVVTPAIVPIPQFSPPVGYLSGGQIMNRRTPYITSSVSGVRDYVHGDSLNRIHWPSTARTGRLISKEFELDPLADVWVFLDMEAESQVASAWTPEATEPLSWVFRRADQLRLPPSTVEYGVTIAASLAHHFLRLDREVGFLSYARTREVVQPDRGERQLARLLEILAVIQARGHIPLAQVLANEGAHLTRHTMLLVITPSADHQWVTVLRGLKLRGVMGVGILLAARTFGPAADYHPVLADLQSSGVPAYLVRRGDDLASALSHLASGWFEGALPSSTRS